MTLGLLSFDCWVYMLILKSSTQGKSVWRSITWSHWVWSGLNLCFQIKPTICMTLSHSCAFLDLITSEIQYQLMLSCFPSLLRNRAGLYHAQFLKRYIAGSQQTIPEVRAIWMLQIKQTVKTVQPYGAVHFYKRKISRTTKICRC